MTQEQEAEEILKKSFDKNVKPSCGLSFEEVKGERGYNWIYEAMLEFAATQRAAAPQSDAELYCKQLLAMTKYFYRKVERPSFATTGIYKQMQEDFKAYSTKEAATGDDSTAA